MRYGLIACLTSKPGQRDTVVAVLTAAAPQFGVLGCRHYVVGSDSAPDDARRVTEFGVACSVLSNDPADCRAVNAELRGEPGRTTARTV